MKSTEAELRAMADCCKDSFVERRETFSRLFTARQMKLFIWNDPYDVPYGGSCLYVLAETLEEARALAKKSKLAPYGDPWREELDYIDVDKKEPSRIIEGPYSEVYYWQE